MAGRVMGSNSEPGPGGRFYCRITAVSHWPFLSNLQTPTFSSRPWLQSSLGTVTKYGNPPHLVLVT